MKKLFLVLFVVAAAAVLVAPAYATELWDFHLRGVDEGLAAGALPPPGVYFINNTYFAPSLNGFGAKFGAPSGTENRNVKLFAYIDVPILLWVPGCQFLGADYAMAIAEPFDYTNLRIQLLHTPVYTTGAQWGAYNTVLVPYELSWKLPCDFYVKTGLAVGLNDGTSNPATADTLGPGAFAPSSNGYYTFEPTLGLSWLHEGWNLSAGMGMDFNTTNTGTGYTSGDMFRSDYTFTKTCGKWTFGAGVAEETQFTTDTVHGSTIPDSKAEVWTAGPIVGYNFGPCSLQFIYNFPIYTNNDVGGEWFNVRFVVPLWK